MLFDAKFWDGIVWTALTSVVTSGVVAGVLQVVLKARYDVKLAEYSRQTDSELARLTNDLSRESTRTNERFKQRFSLLAARQIDAIETIYKNLADTHSALLQLVSPARIVGGLSDEELWTALSTARCLGQSHFRATRIYLPPDLGTEVDDIYYKVVTSEHTFRFRVLGSEHKGEALQQTSELSKEANGEIASTLRRLEVSFRRLVAGDVD